MEVGCPVSKSTRALTILIDGPSGAGKTWVANYLAKRWRADRSLVVLRMDDIYPGWDGLESATTFIDEVVAPARALNLPIRWQRYDWATERCAEWNDIAADADLIIEGCGCLTETSAQSADLSLWIDADDSRRKMIALGRGGEDFDQHWDQWDRQFQRFLKIHTPQRHASLVVRSTR